jgi:succinyl-CoA synthetase alpha subunit
MIIPEEDEPVIVQGITGRYGSLHTKLMLQYGTKIAAGVTPGKGGMEVEGVPVFNTVKEAVGASGSISSVLFVPAPNFLSAAKEAIESGIKLLVAITEHVPIRDTLAILEFASINKASVIGPNTPGIIVPSRKLKLGIMPASSFAEGNVAIFSRSGTLMYEVAYQLTKSGLGQTIALGIGGDPINCTTLEECLELVREDKFTKAVVIVGEIGGDAEERIARYISQTKFGKPVVAYVAGRHAPKEKKMGHAGAIIYGSYGTAESKIKALEEAGASIAKTPFEIPSLVSRAIG